MPKKYSRNAYSLFCLDMIPELRRRGLEVSGVRDAFRLCSQDWALLTVDEKQKYFTKAKESKNPKVSQTRTQWQPGCVNPRKNYSLGAHVAEVLQQEQEPKHPEIFCQKMAGLEKKVIYIIDIFSHGDMPNYCNQRFVPCEIGCVRYSLQDGILGSFHDFIDPGELPFGFRSYCQIGSNSTHQIPVSGFNLANSDYHNLFRSLCEFICPVPSPLYIQVYCKREDMYRVRWCLQWLAFKAGMDNRFEVFDIENLIMNFYRHKINEEPSKYSVDRLLGVFYWDYSSNTRCKWHEENDLGCCALGSCKKITYCISKNLAPLYGVTLTSAHLPELELEKERQSLNHNRTIIVNSKRYQQRVNQFNVDGDPARFDGAASTSRPGQATFIPSLEQGWGRDQGRGVRGRGRGILRLLEETPELFSTMK
ncbi:protein maelstrom homolog [Pyxicephalus adspersus]|uniref:Protein maelstrom homolog n=1 Tax=Pyxicephalus adspersus TaxID=30357 RepID=A0AAV3AT69_PYXAD|nr:TPA: hypothetical protein GDO54_002124 [Pyxicephalus adspersus]